MLRRTLDAVARAALYGALVWAPLASGAYRGWPLAILTVLVVVGLGGWLGGMLVARRLEGRGPPLRPPPGPPATLGFRRQGLRHAARS